MSGVQIFMKPVITFLLLLISECCFTQDFKVSATSQSWSGGVCCRHGVNYSVTVNTGKLDIDSIKVLSICIETKRYTSSSLRVVKNKNSFTCSFGYSVDGNEYDRIDDEYISKKDIDQPCGENLIIFKLNGEIFSLKIEQIVELGYIAYP